MPDACWYATAEQLIRAASCIVISMSSDSAALLQETDGIIANAAATRTLVIASRRYCPRAQRLLQKGACVLDIRDLTAEHESRIEQWVREVAPDVIAPSGAA